MIAYITSANGKTTYYIKRDSGWFEKVVCENGKRKLSGTGMVKSVYGAKFQNRIDAVINEVKQALIA